MLGEPMKPTVEMVMMRGPIEASKKKHRRSDKGFSLIEVLVTLVIFSIGLLGMAALQNRALKISYASFQRSLATLQAQDLVERFWANTCVLSDSTIRNAIIKDWTDVHNPTNRPATMLSMPNWSQTVSYDTASGLITITIAWQDYMVNSGQVANGEAQSFVQYVQVPTVTCI